MSQLLLTKDETVMSICNFKPFRDETEVNVDTIGWQHDENEWENRYMIIYLPCDEIQRVETALMAWVCGTNRSGASPKLHLELQMCLRPIVSHVSYHRLQCVWKVSHFCGVEWKQNNGGGGRWGNFPPKKYVMTLFHWFVSYAFAKKVFFACMYIYIYIYIYIYNYRHEVL